MISDTAARKLAERGIRVDQRKERQYADCPACKAENARKGRKKLSVDVRDGKVLWKCFRCQERGGIWNDDGDARGKAPRGDRGTRHQAGSGRHAHFCMLHLGPNGVIH
jgi:hypothetical protein